MPDHINSSLSATNELVSANSNSTFSAPYQFFLWASAFIVLVNVLILNDWMALWQPWEEVNLAVAFSTGEGLNLPQRILALMEETDEQNMFLLRLPGIFLLVFGAGLSYWIGKPIFGKRTILESGLVLGTSFVLLFCAKLVVNDVWLLAVQLPAALAMLRYLKEPILKWGLLFWGLVLLGLTIHPWSMAIAFFVFGFYLRFVHPEGKRLDKLLFWVLPLVLFVAPNKMSGFIFSYGDLSYWKYLGILLLGFLPWTGFLVASFADLVYKLRKREEMAIIVGGVLLAGLVGQSLLLVAALALMIARQLSAYFHPNYPYRSLARGCSIIHLLFSFFGITYLLLHFYALIGGTGFRAIMFAGVVYWVLTFTGVIGVFGDHKRLILIGMAWGALISFFLILVRSYPILAPVLFQ